jgi:hypothetical protein
MEPMGWEIKPMGWILFFFLLTFAAYHIINCCSSVRIKISNKLFYSPRDLFLQRSLLCKPLNY